MLIRVAMARELAGPWNVVNGDVWRNLPQKPDWQRYEDPDVARFGGEYHMLVEDNNQKRPTAGFGYGIHFHSADGVSWRLADPPVAYTTTIAYDDGKQQTVYRRERPQMIVQNDRLTHILTAVKEQNDQTESRIVVQALVDER